MSFVRHSTDFPWGPIREEMEAAAAWLDTIGVRFQRSRIAPESPRALYFNDDVYIGYVPTGPVLEIATVDPNLGPVYYNLLQRQRGRLSL